MRHMLGNQLGLQPTADWLNDHVQFLDGYKKYARRLGSLRDGHTILTICKSAQLVTGIATALVCSSAQKCDIKYMAQPSFHRFFLFRRREGFTNDYSVSCWHQFSANCRQVSTIPGSTSATHFNGHATRLFVIGYYWLFSNSLLPSCIKPLFAALDDWRMSWNFPLSVPRPGDMTFVEVC